MSRAQYTTWPLTVFLLPWQTWQTLLQTTGWSPCGSSKETVFFGYRIHCWATQFPQLKTFEKWQTRICSHLRHKVPSNCLYPGPPCRAVRFTGTLRGRQAFLASGTPGMNRRCSGASYLAACISLRYLTMQKTTQSHVEIDDLDKLHSNISLRKIPKPSKPQLKNIQSSKFSTRTRHFFAVKKGGGCLDQWAHSLTFQHGMCHAGNRVSTNSREPWVPSGKEVTSMLHPGKIASVVGLVWLVCGGGVATQKDPVPTLAGTTALTDHSIKG